MKSIKPLIDTVNKLEKKINMDSGDLSETNGKRYVTLTSLEVLSNHLDSSNSFNGKDTDVERFLSMCLRQFNYYKKFYTSEEKKVKFIEAHLDSAS